MAGGILRAPSLVDGVVVPSESERMVEPPVEPLRELLGVSRLWFTPASAPASFCTSSISGESLGFLGHRIDFHGSKKRWQQLVPMACQLQPYDGSGFQRSGVGQSGYGFAAPSKLSFDMELIFLLFAICCLLHKRLLLGLHCGFNSVQE